LESKIEIKQYVQYIYKNKLISTKTMLNKLLSDMIDFKDFVSL